MDQPKWLDEAWRELGQGERAGAADNPRILALYRDAGHAEIKHDETAWCAAFVGACLKRAAAPPSGSLMARSYLGWGAPLLGPRTGAVAIISRGSNPALGHVGFLVGETPGEIILLGGNQGDAVTVGAYAKSRLLGLRWPEVHKVEPVAAAGLFKLCLAHVLKMEGGYSDDPYDPGGPTNKGITLRVYCEWKGVTVDATSFAALKDDLKRIADSDVEAIYDKRYWQPAECAGMPAAVALMHFDAAVNHGPGTAIRILQQALGVDTDGEIGPLTLAALSKMAPAQILERYAGLRRERYRALPHFWRFGRGWLARADQTLAAAKSLEKHSSTPEKGSQTMTSSSAPMTSAEPKWWGDSMTIWGATVTALAAILPALAAIGGVTLTPELIQNAGAHLADAAQAIIALTGTILTVYGRVKARQPLERRVLSMRI